MVGFGGTWQVRQHAPTRVFIKIGKHAKNRETDRASQRRQNHFQPNIFGPGVLIIHMLMRPALLTLVRLRDC